MLDRVCRGYKNLSAAQLYLGDLEFDAGSHEAALEHYQKAHARAPAWIRPVQGMLTAYQQLLRQREYDRVKEQIRQREQQLRQPFD